jgi:hypothetical protein
MAYSLQYYDAKTRILQIMDYYWACRREGPSDVNIPILTKRMPID